LTVGIAQAQNSRGSLRGVVQDATQARIASAAVVVASTSSAFTRQVAADRFGVFQFDGLAPGEYQVHVAATGFVPATATVTVSVGTVRNVSVTLNPVAVQQSASVQAQASSVTEQEIDMASAAHQSVITSRDLESLPLPARSFANIAYLAPGTEPVEPSDPTKAHITAVSTGGSSGLNNELSVDGGDNSDDYIGGFLQNYSPDDIREFNVRTAQEDADTGGTTAGSIIITTKSGSNTWYGDAAFYERAAALNARFPIENPAPNPKQPFSLQNYVSTLGGPIYPDKLWFFIAFEAVRENASIAYSPASITQFNALASLASQGVIPGVTSIAVPNNVPIPFRDYLASARIDWSQSGKSQWYLRDSIDNYTTHNDLVQQATLPSTGLLAHNNYLSMVIGNEYAFAQNILGKVVFNAGALHLTQARNSDLGFALAFPFSSTAATISGFETFGDNQFATPITFFPSIRNQEKYQFRYDLSYARSRHTLQFGINFVHEPVLEGTFPDNPEVLHQFPLNPTDYLAQPAGSSTFADDYASGATSTTLGGGFSQNIQRVAFYAEDSWRVSSRLTANYGLRYSTTDGLFTGSGNSQLVNPGYLTLKALDISLVPGAPHDDRKQFAPRIGLAYSPGNSVSTVIRAGFGLYFNDLAQNGWDTALQGQRSSMTVCTNPTVNPAAPDNANCVPGSGTANLFDSSYKTPYAIHSSIGIEHAFRSSWLVSADFIHEQGNHAYRAYSYAGGVNLFTPLFPATDTADQTAYVPNVDVFHSDNRSSYNGLLIHIQGNVSRRFNLIGNYTLSKAQTWGCVLGELFDYVNGVCNPLQPFAPGDYGPSGEDVRDRAVIAGTLHAPGGVDLNGLAQFETARPFTITNSDNSNRISIGGVPTTLDQFRGKPYIQVDLRVSRPINLRDNWHIMPFAEFFNLFNRNNPGANYVTNVASLPVTCANPSDPTCTNILPPANPNQLRVPGGALGDFFGSGTTVGAPFAAQLGVRAEF
jgi:hypothetical protein